MTPSIAAFFDLHNTIIPGSAIERDYFFLLWRQGLVGIPDFAKSGLWLLRNIPPFSLDPLRGHQPYLARQPVAEIESQARAFYGDSPGDRPALESGGHPRVVNPMRGMARTARQRGWPILHRR